MLLTIDVGNTNTVLGVFRGEELIANWRLTTARQQTVDEYGVLTRNLFTIAGLDRDAIGGGEIGNGLHRGISRRTGLRVCHGLEPRPTGCSAECLS